MSSIPPVGPWTIVAWLMRRRIRFRVSGDSMVPTLHSSSHIFVARYRGRAPKVGDVIVARHPYEQRILIKRIERIEAGRIWLKSDNPSEGTDSRSFGSIAEDAILGRVVAQSG